MDDAAGFFANVFGGERFRDYVSSSSQNSLSSCQCRCLQIGEISLMKEMTSVATTMMTEEEKTELEREMNEGITPASPTLVTPSLAPAPASPRAFPADGASSPTGATLAPSPARSPSPSSVASPGPGTPGPDRDPLAAASRSPASSSTNLKDKDKDKDKDKHVQKEKETHGKKRKLTPEQKQKLQELDDERKKSMEERIDTLNKKLIERLRPFVEAKHPGAKDDPETVAFENKIRREADDMKLESFGVELLQTIGNIYIMKATSFLKSRKFLGMWVIA